MGLINGSQNNNEQEEDPNLQSFLSPYSPSFYLLDKENSKNKTIQKVLEESLNENIGENKLNQKENLQKTETTSTEAEEKIKENNNNIDENFTNNIAPQKVPDESINQINNTNDIKTQEIALEEDSANEPLKYKSSSLEKDIRHFYKFKDFLGEGHFGSVRTAFKKREYSPHKLFAVKCISLKKL